MHTYIHTHLHTYVFFFLSSTTVCEFWLAQLFLSMVSFPVPSVLHTYNIHTYTYIHTHII